MSKKPSPFNQIIHILQDLHKTYPAQNVGRHLSMALADYGDIWGVSDKEIAFALEKYQLQLDSDPLSSQAEIDRIILDAENLETLFRSDEEEEGY